MPFGDERMTEGRAKGEERERSRNLISCVSFLGTGQEFVGTQNVSSAHSHAHTHSSCMPGMVEPWKLTVKIQGTDLHKGYLCGVMEALNVPAAKTSVITFWEGHIVDNVNHTFFTQGWDASRETDFNHWTKFRGFDSLKEAVQRDGATSVDLASHPYIFMRWKERFFVNVSADCGLTIAGFYYICYSREDGSIQGYYYDPNSTPFQKLDLKPRNDGRCGHTFGSFHMR